MRFYGGGSNALWVLRGALLKCPSDPVLPDPQAFKWRPVADAYTKMSRHIAVIYFALARRSSGDG